MSNALKAGPIFAAHAATALLLCAGAASATVPVSLVAKVGDNVGGRTVTGVGQPFTDGLGSVGFVMLMGDGTRSIWHGGGEVFNSSSAAPDVLTGSEDTMGVGDAGGWIYSPSFNGQDAVYTNNGKLLADDDPHPALPGMFATFNSRPRMSANGTAWWVGGAGTTAAGSTTQRGIFKNATPANPAATVAVLKGGDVVSGLTVSSSTFGFAYDMSDNANHYLHVSTFTGQTAATDTGIVVDGVVVAREGSPTGGGDNWQNWRFVGVNNSGNYTICGDTSAAADDFVTFNNTIAVRQGDTLDGLLLGATVDMVSINNLNQIAMIWDLAAGGEGLFLGDGASLSSAGLLLRTGDALDTDGDLIADFTLTDFTASATIAPGLDLSDSDTLYVNASLTPVAGGSAVEAIIGVGIPTPGTAGMFALLGIGGLRRRR